ncbi:uncharacterized protein BDW47DRAFT_47608 [Aspergillus candidus]|uniref:Uncharacterized protein n=1 Tax=Aspergillus candidus TaxID=41067 RepID=A0A2I2F7S0_ASPCN|nr:hypothetical protein BDW47DRAFT_47608 [Aspergillus candidus]PLB36671.1 hypothetical protein BDW47DRAFT_47608 [Aspergillus candidus]
MFGFSGKRPRETEEWGDACERYPENKRLRPLTLRTSTSPSVHKPPVVSVTRANSRVGLTNLTPVESSEDEDDRKSRPPTGIDSRHAHQDLPSRVRSASTEMDIDSGRDSGHHLDPDQDSDPTPNLFQPSPLPSSRINESLTISDFQPMGSGAGDAMASSTPDHNYGPSLDRWWVPRLPSPVSDGADDPTSSKCSPSDIEMTFHPLSPRDQPRKWQVAPDGPSRGFLVESPQPSSSGTTAATSKKKVGFSMGYRSDCDKCRRKVPGHYSHIIRD